MEAFCPSNYLEGNMCLLVKSLLVVCIALVQLADTIYFKLYKCSIITLFVFVNYSVYPASVIAYLVLVFLCIYFSATVSVILHCKKNLIIF